MEIAQEVLGSLGFNIHIALANFFNFLIIFFLLQKFLFKKIKTTLDERHKVIEDGVKRSEESERMLKKAHTESRHIVEAAEKKADDIVKDGESKGGALALSLKQEAEKDIEKLKKEAGEEKARGYDAGISQFSQEKEKLLAQLFEKALLGHVTKDSNNAFIASLKK